MEYEILVEEALTANILFGRELCFFFIILFFMFESLNFIMKNKIKYALANYVD